MHMGSNERGAYYDKTGKGQRYLSDAVVDEQKNWPTANARDWKDSITGTHPPSRPRMSEQTLGQAVSVIHGQADPANWPTPNCMDVITPTRDLTQMESKGHWGKNMNTGKLSEMVNYGQAAPASSSSHGSRQGLWPTAEGMAGGKTSRGGSRKDELLLSGMVKQWATPAAFDWNVPEAQAAWAKRAATQKSKGVNLHLPLKSQAVHEAEKQWATPRNCGGPDYAKTTRPSSQSNSLSLPTQVAGRLNSQWVTQLMGLNLGFVSPSCPASVIKNWPRFVSGWSALTIAPMSCDSSVMESCLPPHSELSEFSLASWPSPRAGESQQTEELSRLWVENGFKQPKTRSGKARANGSTFDVTLETAARGVAAMERQQ
jgi:hypothetical protein